MGLGVRGLKDLIPNDSGASQRSAQFMQQAQNQKYIPQGNSGNKTVGGAISTGLSGVMAGQSLASLLPAASAATTTAAGGGMASLGLGAGTAAGEFAMSGLGAGLAAGATEAAIPSVVAAGAGETAALGGAAAAGAAGLSMAAVAPWAIGALALGSYLFG